jgi:hypothetical protein
VSSETPRLKRRGFLKSVDGGLHPYPRTAFIPAINGGVFCGIFIKKLKVFRNLADTMLDMNFQDRGYDEFHRR